MNKPTRKHLCHAKNCNVPVPPKMFMCRSHWFLLPKRMRDMIWKYYRPGQEIDKQPSDNYIRAAKVAIAYLAQVESK